MIKKGLFGLLLLSTSVYAQDVIYMNDGSIVRGNITDTKNNGDVNIELEDGDEFTLKEYNIKKITYEKKIPKKKNSKKDRIASFKHKLKVDNKSGSRSGYSSFSSKSSNSTPTISTPSSFENDHIAKHNISIGTIDKIYLDSDDDGAFYSGAALAYQYSFDRNLALYVSYGYGRLKHKIVNGEARDDLDSVGSNGEMKQYKLTSILSTNNNQGWQFFTGLGYFSETISGWDRYFSEYYSDSAAGFSIPFGIAYSWNSFVLRYRISFERSDDYEEDTLGTSGNLQLSWNL